MEKKCKKAKWLSEEALQIAVKRREAIALAIRGFLYFHTNLEIICSSSVKNVAGSLTGIALNL